MDIYAYWDSILTQNAEKMRIFFNKDAKIFWHNTNEKFTVNEFIKINCEYPGKWKGNIEKIEKLDNLLITVTQVASIDENISFKAISFIKLKEEKIISIDEYWSENLTPPQWRLDLKVGDSIK